MEWAQYTAHETANVIYKEHILNTSKNIQTIQMQNDCGMMKIELINTGTVLQKEILLNLAHGETLVYF